MGARFCAYGPLHRKVMKAVPLSFPTVSLVGVAVFVVVVAAYRWLVHETLPPEDRLPALKLHVQAAVLIAAASGGFPVLRSAVAMFGGSTP